MGKHEPLLFEWLSFKPVAALLILASSLVGAASAASFTVVDLATLAQGSTVVVRGPNGLGNAVGGARLAGATRGLLFARERPQPVIGLPGSDYTTLYGINDIGDVVGGSNTATAVRAFLSNRASATRELPPLPGDTGSTAFAVNNHRQAVGVSSGPRGEHAVLWGADGSVALLPASAGITSRALGVNDRGDVVGTADIGGGPRAILWSRGASAQNLGMLSRHATSVAASVNARGDVVGYSADAASMRRATLWPSGGGIVDLGTLPGGDFSQALGNNDAGNIVGTSTSPFGTRAFLWTPSSGLQDLNDLIAPSPFVLTEAVGINNKDMIVAIGHEVADAAGSAGHDHDSHELPVRVLLLLRSGVQP